LIDFVAPAHASLIVRGRAEASPGRPPRFLCELAAREGLAIDSHRFGLSARGKYNSNKVVFFLFKPGERDAETIVKMTRVEQFNNRLEHEGAMLAEVKQRHLAPAGTYPERLFSGYHKGLAVLGQRAMRGQPFRARTTAGADCPFAASAVEWITALGSRSAVRSRSAGCEAEKQLEALMRLFCGIYRISAAHRAFLGEQIGRIGQRSEPFPIVFNHGDAGSWNIVVNDGGQALFLDWEAAEPRGMPLWDLFYFLRSFGNWASRQASGNLDTLASFRDSFMQAGPLNELLVDAVRHYCEEVGLQRELIGPMLFTCWMHRALRQATWADRLENAHFVNLLRMCIDGRDEPGLVKLFGEN
jgi:hypothetical protein